jgi:hypothetical protein
MYMLSFTTVKRSTACSCRCPRRGLRREKKAFISCSCGIVRSVATLEQLGLEVRAAERAGQIKVRAWREIFQT